MKIIIINFIAIFILISACTHSTEPVPDNIFPKIAFISWRDGNREIYLMNHDGSEQINLTRNPADDGDFEFSPDGNWIVFRSTLHNGYSDLYTMDQFGRNRKQLTDSLYIRGPSFSPSGGQIVFIDDPFPEEGSTIYVIDSTGENLVNLTQDPGGYGTAIFSPAGSTIIYDAERDGNQEIYSMSLDGKNHTNLTNNSAHDFLNAITSDGSKIVFTSLRDGTSTIYIMNSNGSDPVNITNNAARDWGPILSPDGNRIVFKSKRDAPGPGIYIMDIDGKNVIRLTHNQGIGFTVRFSPNGTELVFVSYDDLFGKQLSLLDLTTNLTIRLTNTPGLFPERPQFSAASVPLPPTTTAAG